MEQEKTNNIPLENVVYARLSRSIWFYIRHIKSGRSYPSEIAQFDKLFLVGIYDPKTGIHLEFPYSYEDQRAMWRNVLKVIVKPDIRKELLEQWYSDVREFMQDGNIQQAFLPTNVKKSGMEE